MVRSFEWNLIPLIGTLVDRAYMKKFIRRYIILLKLHSSSDDSIKNHFKKLKSFKKVEKLIALENLEAQYMNLDRSCDSIYEKALENFAHKFPSFKSFTSIFRFDNPISVSIKTCTEIGLKTITGFFLAIMVWEERFPNFCLALVF